jgi:DNA-binding MarR family transcriptional regulator
MAARPHPNELETLLAGITALANRLKKRDRMPHAGQFPPVGKNILSTLDMHGPQTVPQLARLYATSRQNIQTAVNALIAARCLTLADNPAHKRSRLVALTDAGRARLQSATQHEATFLAPIAEHIKAEEISAALNIITRLRALLDGGPLPEIKLMPAPLDDIRWPRQRVPRVRRAPKVAPVTPPPVAPTEPEADDSLPFNLL